MKPKVVVCVLTGLERESWINPELAVNLITMVRDPRFEVVYYPVQDVRPRETARNVTVVTARQNNADWLISFDNDNFTHCNPLDVIAEAGPNQHIIGLTYAIVAGKTGIAAAPEYKLLPDRIYADDGAFSEVEFVSGGCLMVRNTVWKKIPTGPWFRRLLAENELLAPQRCSEDAYFCALARQQGFKVWTHTQQLAGHYRTTDVTGMVCSIARVKVDGR
jgi:hypothetical protein